MLPLRGRRRRLIALATIAPVATALLLAAAAPGARNGAAAWVAASTRYLAGNRVQCGVNNQGDLCAHTGGIYRGGGFWPAPPNQYIFASGVQVAAIVAADGGPWAGDTVGAYLSDTRGTQPHGQGVTDIYSSADSGDAAAWPSGAVIRDASVFEPWLLGRSAASLEDSWVRYWDGPTLLSGRPHPMGILVEQRSLQFGYPVGNEDVLYWVFTLYNITASDPAAYTGLDPAIQGEIAAIGAEWTSRTEADLGVSLPARGITFDSLYLGNAWDPDVGDAGHNNSSAILPFNTSIAYKSDFDEPTWDYPLTVAATPFGPHPGVAGMALLRTPAAQTTGAAPGMTLFSNISGGHPFPDPVGVSRLWRYLSASVDPAWGDPPCTIGEPRARRLCALVQGPTDTRSFQASGPFRLRPGTPATFVVAYVFAGALADAIEPLAGADLRPGIPPSGPRLMAGLDTLRALDRAAGWLSHADLNADGDITPDEVQTVPRSFLAKVRMARGLAERGFLLASAPEPPAFHLLPGDGRVTVVWTRSETENTGDPFFAAAADPTSGLYDPNFRPNDVEGYRVYRGRHRDRLELIAQYDYAGSTFTDYTGIVDYGQGCAPELGLTTRCPTFPREHPLGGTLVQVPPGGRTLVGDNLVVFRADTAPRGTQAGLNDTGVPFALVDSTVENFGTYYYAVTAFDVNSAASQPGSLESPIVVKSVTARPAATNRTVATMSMGLFGDDDVELDPSVTWRIDANTGRFQGTPPPTNAIEAVFAPLVSELLPGVTVTVTVDSVRLRTNADAPGFTCGAADNGFGGCSEFHVTFADGSRSESFRTLTMHPVWSAFGSPSVVDTQLGAFRVAADSAAAARYGIAADFTTFLATLDVRLRETIRFSSFEGQHARRYTSGRSPGGSRWFAGENETVDHPTYGVRVGSGLPRVDSVWAPIHHTDANPDLAGSQAYPLSSAMQCYGYVGAAAMTRQADVRFTWAGGTFGEVRDLTHQVDVRFHPETHATWGFVSDNNGNGLIDWKDFDALFPFAVGAEPLGYCAVTDPGPGAYGALRRVPTLLPVAAQTADAGSEFGSGIGLYVNGERYLFALDGGTLPPDGTQWTLRTHAGVVRASSGGDTRTPGGYSFTPVERPPVIEGLRVVISVDGPTTALPATDSTLARVHTLPDPFYVTNELQTAPNERVLKFVNLPDRVLIRIYSLSGVLVHTIEHNDPTLGGEATWDLRNRGGRVVASGVYFYHVETADGAQKIGRFTVVTGGSYGRPEE